LYVVVDVPVVVLVLVDWTNCFFSRCEQSYGTKATSSSSNYR